MDVSGVDGKQICLVERRKLLYYRLWGAGEEKLASSLSTRYNIACK